METNKKSINVKPTNFVECPSLSKLLGANITLADETKQHTGSFKFRAAYNLVSKVPNKHIITASSGNFGQALAYACSLLGKTCTVVMPATTIKAKIEGVNRFGGQIELVDTTKIGRAERVAELSKQFPDAFVASPYDSPLIIEGNSGLGEEICNYRKIFDFVIVPIGGGGLASGIITGIKNCGKNILVVGAEPAMANDAARSLRAGHIITNEQEPQSIADGARTISVGKHNWPILQAGLHKIIEVPEESIKEAVKLIYQHARLNVEPTGALALAAILVEPKSFANKNICCIVSGGNFDQQLFESIISK